MSYHRRLNSGANAIMGNWNYAILGGDDEFEFIADFGEKMGVPIPPLAETEDQEDMVPLHKRVLLSARNGACRENLEALPEAELFDYLDEWSTTEHISLVAACLYMAAGAKLPAALLEQCLFWAEEPKSPAEDESQEEFEERAEDWLSNWADPGRRQEKLNAFAKLLRNYDGTPLREETIDELAGSNDEE